MTKMIERVARALCPVDPDSDTELTSNGKWYQRGTPHWHSWIGEARAVLAAIEEPTPDMIGAGAGACAGYGFDDVPMVTEENAADTWRKMVRAARGET